MVEKTCHKEQELVEHGYSTKMQLDVEKSLKLREVLLPMLKFNLNDRNAFLFWQNPWLRFGEIFCRSLTHGDIIQSGIPWNEKFASLTGVSGLRLPVTRTQGYQHFGDTLGKALFTQIRHH